MVRRNLTTEKREYLDFVVDNLRPQGFTPDFYKGRFEEKRNVLLTKGEDRYLVVVAHPFDKYKKGINNFTEVARTVTRQGIPIIPIFRQVDFPEDRTSFGNYRVQYSGHQAQEAVRVSGLIKVVAGWAFGRSQIHFVDPNSSSIHTYVFRQNLYTCADVQRDRNGNLREIPEWAQRQDLIDIVEPDLLEVIDTNTHTLDLEEGTRVDLRRILPGMFLTSVRAPVFQRGIGGSQGNLF